MRILSSHPVARGEQRFSPLLKKLFYFFFEPVHSPVNSLLRNAERVSYIGVTLGTGVGGGILTGGRLLEGARGLGGELGHFRTHALDGVFCTCGASGCWERYAATTALVRGAQPRNPKWKDGRAIFESAHAGDPTILALLDDWTDEIAQGLAGMVHIFNPQLILIGGGVSAQQELLIDPVAKKVRASVMPAFAEGLEIRAAQLHNDAGMVGAVYYFRQSRGEI